MNPNGELFPEEETEMIINEVHPYLCSGTALAEPPEDLDTDED